MCANEHLFFFAFAFFVRCAMQHFQTRLHLLPDVSCNIFSQDKTRYATTTQRRRHVFCLELSSNVFVLCSIVFISCLKTCTRIDMLACRTHARMLMQCCLLLLAFDQSQNLWCNIRRFVLAGVCTMPPKQGKAKQREEPKPDSDTSWISKANSRAVAALQTDIALMKSTKIIKSAFGADPPTICNGGHMEPYNQAHMKKALWRHTAVDRATYKCGGNALWPNILFSMTPGVAWNTAQLKLVKESFQGLDAPETETFEWEIHVAVENADFKITPGGMEFLSVEEPLVATCQTVADLIRELTQNDPKLTQTTSQKRWQRWANTLRRATYVFHKFVDADWEPKYFLAVNSRRKFIKDAARLKRTPGDVHLHSEYVAARGVR